MQQLCRQQPTDVQSSQNHVRIETVLKTTEKHDHIVHPVLSPDCHLLPVPQVFTTGGAGTAVL